MWYLSQYKACHTSIRAQVQSFTPMEKGRACWHVLGIHCWGEGRQAEPWASLTSQPSQCGEFQAEGETLSQKSKWKAPEKRHWRLASGLYMHEHVSTPVLSPTYKIWSKQKSCESNFQKMLTLWSCCIKSAPCQYPGHWVTFQSLTLKNSMGLKRRLGH